MSDAVAPTRAAPNGAAPAAPVVRVVATAGHVDHGKSTLVRALTGTDPDRWEEERRRGMTIDLGFAHTTLPSGAQVSFVDVPGHVRFIRNMLAGAGALDLCLFVVAATEGWKPQTEEHLRILDLLGHRRGVIALTKADLADADLVEVAALEVTDHVTGTFLDGAPIVPVAATTGRGLDELRAALDDLVRTSEVAGDRDRPRLWVDRSFAARGSGTVVTGTLTGGHLAVDDRVDILPHGRTARIRALQSHGSAVPLAGPGTRVAVNLVGVEHHEVGRGDAVVRAAQWRPTTRFDASLHVLAALDHPVSRRGAHTVHLGAGEWPARLRVLGPDAIEPGATGCVRVHLAHPLPLVAGDRFVLREAGRSETVGGGEVLDVRPVLPASRARPDRSVERVVAEHGWIDAADLTALTGASRPATVGTWVVDPAVLGAATAELRAAVERAGPVGLGTAELGDRQRALLPLLDGIRVADGRATLEAARDELAAHPLLERLRAEGLAPGEVTGVDRGTLRALVQRGLLVSREGFLFHPDAIERAANMIGELLRAHPEGVTVGQCRDHLGITRKHAVPVLAELDARGVTRRRGDLRVAGPSRSPGEGTAV